MRTAQEQNAWEAHADRLADKLLPLLEKHTGARGLAYADAPRRLAGGHWAGLYAFRLAHAPAEASGELVLRVLPASDELGAREARVQSCVAAAGFPAPRVLISGGRAAGLGFPFIVMQRLPGTPAAALPAPQLLRVPRLLGDTLSRLHALDPAPAATTLEDLDVVFHDLEERSLPLAEAGFGAALDWLRRHRPAAKRRVICHGDFHPLNLLMHEGRVTGVVDWTQARLAEPEFDVAYARLLLTLWPVRMRNLPRSWAKALIGAPAARQFLSAYRARATVDDARLPWYEALHAFRMVLRIARARAGITLPPLGPRHPWEIIAQDARRAFERRTRLSINLPPPCAIPQAS